MAQIRNTFDGGTPGAAMTTSNTGGDSGTPFTAVEAAATDTNVYVSVGGVLRPAAPHIRVAGAWRAGATDPNPTPPPSDAWDLAMTQGTVSPNLITGRWYDTQWTGNQPTHSGGVFTSSRPAITSSAQWRSETYAAGNDYSATSGRIQLQRYERFVFDFEVNLATGHTTNDNGSHDVIAQLIGRTTANFWPGPPMALVFQNGTFRVMNNPAPFGPNEEMTSINGSGVAGRLNLGADTLGQWHRFIISIYLDGPGQGTIDMWANGVHYCQGWKPTAGTWYTDSTYTHEYVFPKMGMYGSANGARAARSTQHRNVRVTRHQGATITTQRSTPVG